MEKLVVDGFDITSVIFKNDKGAYETFARCGRSSETVPEDNANARLIAHAVNCHEELLKMLKESVQWVAKCAADHDGEGDIIGVRAKRVVENMEVIIAKAE